MTPMSAAILAVLAAMISMSAAATSFYLRRERQRVSSPTRGLGDLERAVDNLVQRLEATAGRCIHDLESREARLRGLLAGEDGEELPGLASRAIGAEESYMPQLDLTAEAAPTAGYFDTDLVSRAARACEMAEGKTDEATICRVLGMQRAELRLLLSLRAAQQSPA